jgi:hypothetical protein
MRKCEPLEDFNNDDTIIGAYTKNQFLWSGFYLTVFFNPSDMQKNEIHCSSLKIKKLNGQKLT